MASLATLAALQPTTTVKGLGGSSLTGTKLHVKTSRQILRPTNYRAGAVVAKYGDKSVYFDLEDLGNTTGQWDLYGSDAPSPYNSLQSKFFETFAAPFTKRGLLLKFLILGGGSTLAYLSSTATGDILPIKKGPQLPPKLGPRGKI
ncbi:photosystem I reaction center subunit VI, chloroplastic-like [Cornus florida]|uniref:photosystem I reaction center subunit VI, chloroplastic-like n=1 Tax=Cornus florida TaxID=4283 RepID=UPI0028A1ED91|nr:photosystem I reaction center subunit VI, chloroplastic-like [Cornus florida]